MTDTSLAPEPLPREHAPLNRPRILSHGTLQCRSLAVSRPFYEDFLGLEVVQHTDRGVLLRKGGYCVIVCIERGERAVGIGRLNHWGLDLATKEDVDRAFALAHELKDRYELKKISRITTHHGTYSFYFQDRDGNWWEFQYVGGGQGEGSGRYDLAFARGDVAAKEA
jgi:catechol 2,3-dioxygenase-like lactoylglutathione lyase family enzyme